MIDSPVLVTGAAGFVGRHVVHALAAAGLTIEAWAHSRPVPSLTETAHACWRTVDVLDRTAVLDAMSSLRPRTIIHCAGAAHIGRSWDAASVPLRTNVLGTAHVLDADRLLHGGARILVPGSATIYAPSTDPLDEEADVHPSSPYAVSKLAQEQLARAAAAEGQHVYVTRSFNHIGPWQSPAFAAASFARQVARIERGLTEPVLRVGNLSPRRDLTDVRDTVAAYFAILERGRVGIPYNVCSGRGTSMQQVVDGLLARSRVTVRIASDPALLRPNDALVLVGSNARLTDDTGWTPTIPLDRTLDDLLAYWRAEVDREAPAHPAG